MERRIDLIRRILLIVEQHRLADRRPEHQFPGDWENFHFGGTEKEVIDYHLALLHDAGLITGDPRIPTVSGLTNAGHDFTACIKEQAIWDSVLARLSDLPGAPLRTYEALAEAEINKRLGLG